MPLKDTRPNPDTLLTTVEREEESQKQGKLKIFFGACAGVGKTYAMLEAARHKKRDGVDVVIGYVEPHKRQETEALIGDLERILTVGVPYKGVTLQEFDLDAALQRKPKLILVDELAHTNAPGSRHIKRWQDIEELLQSGIDVYSTLNAQHLESLNDTIAKITGVIVRETIPDSVFDEADDVELVDLPVAELLQRLKAGKVYMPDQAGRAVENFFQEGNLIALREMALRKTAQRVDAQMAKYRSLHSVHTIWQSGERLLVCISPSPFSTQLIRRTKQLASDSRAPWVAVYVEVPQKPTSELEREAIEKQLRFAESLGAETTILQGLNPTEEILRFAHEKNVTKIVVGKPSHSRLKDIFFGSFVDKLIRQSGEIDVYSIYGEKKGKAPRQKKISRETPWTDYITPSILILAGTLFLKKFSPHTELVNLAMLYLITNVWIAIRYGQGPSLVSTLLSVASFDFFFVPPFFTFAVADSRYFVTFFIMFAVTLLTSRLMVQLRRSAQAASTRERYTANLYALSREMLKSRTTREISENATRHLSQVVQGDVVILLGTEPGLMFLEATSNPNWNFKNTDWAVAQWVCKNEKIAGFGTQTLPSAKAIFFPLIANRGVIGTIGIRPQRETLAYESTDQHFIESVIGQAALAIERAMLSEEAKAAEIEAEREGLMSTLLSSVSHDLRTPLTSIAGAASALLIQNQKGQKLSQEDQKRLLETINDESARLNRLVENILQITKIESGNIHIRKENQSLEEIIGSSLNRLDSLLQGRKITTEIPNNLPLVPMDALLIEQVFINLLENAIRYTPNDSPIDIRAFHDKNKIWVEILDRGNGIPQQDHTRIFEKFYRGNQKNTWGSGLGLAICQGILKAHEGKMRVKDREDGGSIFSFFLPFTSERETP